MSSTICAITVCFSRSRYTGKEIDGESGNNYFGARYYASSMGRFMSPDWSATAEPVPYARLGDPQTLNLYAYLMNNPEAGVDADGHCNSTDALCLGLNAGFDALHEVGNSAAEAQLQQTETQNQQRLQAAKAQLAQQQSTSSTPSQPSDVVTGAAADKQRGLVLDQLSGMLPGTSTDDLNKQLGTDCHAHGGNCDFTMDPSLTVALNTAAGVKNDKDHPNNIADFGGSTYGPHSRFGLSPSLHHNHGEVHVDHFNGGSILGFLPHVIVDVAIGEAFYGSHKVFSY